MQRKMVVRKIPIELDIQLRQLQSNLKTQFGIEVTLVNSGRAAAKLLNNPQAKFIKVIPTRGKRRYHEAKFEV